MENISHINLQGGEQKLSYTYAWATPINRQVSDKPDTHVQQPSKTNDDNDDVAQATWEDFIGGTTFHGCRFIFGGTKLKIRRLAWLLVVSVAVSLFTYQVVSRAKSYFEYHSTINVEVVYADQVIFPTVTICNQNNYRITILVNESLDEYMRIRFAATQADLHALPNTNSTTLSYSDLVSRSSHQLRNMILSCSWDGQMCNISHKFVTILTDFGQCYSFNTEQSSISQKGSAFGLNLVINIEQYEYSWGPHNEAGIKVLLHDPAEAPLVGDLGFAVAPGTQTLVAVRREEILAQPAPYGSCNHSAMPRSYCVLDCKIQTAWEQCGCIDVYMAANYEMNDTICDVGTALTCLNNATGKTSCSCGTPCRRVVYTPELSYAHLSRSNTGSMLPPTGHEMDDLHASYVRAREVSRHVIPGYNRKSVKLFGELGDLSTRYERAVRDAEDVLRGTARLRRATGLSSTLAEMVSAVRADASQLSGYYYGMYSRVVDGFYNKNESPWRNVYILLDSIERDFLPRYEAQRQCVEEEAAGVNSPWSCQMAIIYDQTIYQAIQRTNTLLTPVQVLKYRYLFVIQSIYHNSTDYAAVPVRDDYNECLHKLANLSAMWTEKIRDLKAALTNYTSAQSHAEKLNILTAVYSFYNASSSNDSLLSRHHYQPCEWFVRTDLDTSGMYTLTDAVHAAEAALSHGVTSTAQQGADLAAALKADLGDLFALFGDYLADRNATMVELQQAVTSDEYLRKWEAIIGRQARLSAGYGDVVTHYHDMVSAFSDIVVFIDNASLPWKTETLRRLRVVRLAGAQPQNDTRAAGYTALLEGDARAAMLGLTEHVYGAYSRVLAQAHAELSQTYRELNSAVARARGRLTEFMEDNELDDKFVLENFLKLNIFYKEIGHTLVSQTPAFEFISLLSEVGGFLGLLLGASVLTVCELADYLVLSSLRRCRMGGQIAPGRSIGIKQY